MKLKKGSKEAKAYMAKLRAKRKVGAVAKTKSGKPAKRLTKAQRDYNKDVAAYKYYVVNNGKVEAGFEFKSDAKDMATDFYPVAKVLTAQQLKKAGIKNPSSEWKYTIGSNLKINRKEQRLGATEKDVKPTANGYHKDTKSHNVNIRVVSGISKIGAIDLNTVGKELLSLEKEINELSDFIRRTKSATERKRFKEILSVKRNQFKALKVYLNTIARFK